MIAFLILFLHVLVSPFKARARLEAEIIMLRHQLNVLRRRVPSKPKLAVSDRLLFVWLYRLFASVLNAVTIVQPAGSTGRRNTGVKSLCGGFKLQGLTWSGGHYDGTYQFNPQTNNLDIDAVVTIPPGVWSVNGVAAGNQPIKFPVKASIPRGQLTGYRHTVSTPNGPIEIVLNKIRDFP